MKKKIRIAVVIDSEGKWAASGWSNEDSSNDFLDVCYADLGEATKEYWVDDTLPSIKRICEALTTKPSE